MGPLLPIENMTQTLLTMKPITPEMMVSTCCLATFAISVEEKNYLTFSLVYYNNVVWLSECINPISEFNNNRVCRQLTKTIL